MLRNLTRINGNKWTKLNELKSNPIPSRILLNKMQHKNLTKMIYFVIFITRAPKYSSAHTDKNGHILAKNLAIQKKLLGQKLDFWNTTGPN